MFLAQHEDAYPGTTPGPPEGNTLYKTVFDSYTQVSSDTSCKATEGEVQYVAATINAFAPQIS